MNPHSINSTLPNIIRKEYLLSEFKYRRDNGFDVTPVLKELLKVMNDELTEAHLMYQTDEKTVNSLITKDIIRQIIRGLKILAIPLGGVAVLCFLPPWVTLLVVAVSLVLSGALAIGAFIEDFHP